MIAPVLLLAACTPSRTTMWPYAGDDELTGLVASRAARVCDCLRSGEGLPPRPFTTDGCSMFPDGDWAGCCVAHDIEYWCGGSAEDRRDADHRFASCIERIGHDRAFARIMGAGVRAGGAARSPLPWRWAYGWSGVRGYDSRAGEADAEDCGGR